MASLPEWGEYARTHGETYEEALENAKEVLEDIENELKWQESLSNPDMDLGILQEMAQLALLEDEEGKTEDKGFGEK
ncbi:MAG TPA: hypothetical protein DCQ51_03635 [Planktothrix sp. UBA8407]|nr:hypothetical protein [Planktothrix sp. UBA8402]HAO10279.1 hypothetical protein [Planktothrix sp. UBA8407]HBK23311.1 hypothetical protein [Planktothrix sp. UBA10369]